MTVPSQIPLPLAELHCHIEGTVGAALAQKLAARHSLDLSRIIDPAGGYLWRDFGEFLAAYDGMCTAIRTPEDYIEITLDYFERMARGGLIYGEIFVSPVHAERNGMSYSVFIDALATAFAEIEGRFGTVCRMILTAVRHYGVEHAEATARLAERYPHPAVVGFGMAGDETFLQPRDFVRAFAIARGSGLGLTAHAGELAGPESIRATLEAFPLTRIGHGVRAIEDPSLVPELRARGVTLELCPSSNIALRLYASYREHPVGHYLAEGLKVTLSTDDPGFFGMDVAGEYGAVAAAHGLGRSDLLKITRTAVEAAFCDEATRARLLANIESWASAARD